MGGKTKRCRKKMLGWQKVGNTDFWRDIPARTQSSSHQQHTLHLLGCTGDQGAALGEIKRLTIQETGLGWAFASDHWDCRQSSKLIIGGAQEPKLTWSNEKQVKMILAFIYNESFWESSGKSSENLQISDEIALYLWYGFTLLTSI